MKRKYRRGFSTIAVMLYDAKSGSINVYLNFHCRKTYPLLQDFKIFNYCVDPLVVRNTIPPLIFVRLNSQAQNWKHLVKMTFLLTLFSTRLLRKIITNLLPRIKISGILGYFMTHCDPLSPFALAVSRVKIYCN